MDSNEVYEKKIDDLMQENYHLKAQIDEYRSKEDWYKDEILQLEQATSSSEAKKCEKEFKAKEVELKDKISSLRLELEAALQSDRAHQEKIAELEKFVEENKHCQSEFNGTRVDFDETQGMNVEEQLALLQEEISTLKAELVTNKTQSQSLKMEAEKLKKEAYLKEEELENVKRECVSYCNLLEKTRTENVELTAQLDVMIMQQEEQSHEKKGNSLFSEVEDRRVQAEKTLVSQKKTFEVLKKKNEIYKQHIQKLKMQLYTSMGRGNDDSERVNSLEAQLEEERTERKLLMEKIQKMEENQGYIQQNDRLTEFSKNLSTQAGVDKDYVDFFTNMLKAKEDELSELSRKFSVQGMCLLDQKNKVAEKERLLYAAEVKNDKIWRQYQQLKYEKEELEIELNPGKESTSAPKAVGRTEKIPTGLEGVQEKKSSVLKERTSDNEYKGADRQWALDMLKKFEEEDKIKAQAQAKRSVRMSDDVDVFEADGHISTLTLRDNENNPKLVRDRAPTQGKVTICTKRASEPKYKVDDCNTQ